MARTRGRQARRGRAQSIRRDVFGKEGIFTPEQTQSIIRELEQYRIARNAGYVLNTSYAQSIGGASGTGPHFEMGGYGTGPDDRGIRFFTLNGSAITTAATNIPGTSETYLEPTTCARGDRTSHPSDRAT